MKRLAAWRFWVVAVFGAWFVIDSFVFSAAKAHPHVFLSFLVVGGLILIGGVWQEIQSKDAVWRSWVVAVLSAWMAVSPWALGFSSHPLDTWITLAVGALGVAGSVWVALTQPKGTGPAAAPHPA